MTSRGRFFLLERLGILQVYQIPAGEPGNLKVKLTHYLNPGFTVDLEAVHEAKALHPGSPGIQQYLDKVEAELTQKMALPMYGPSPVGMTNCATTASVFTKEGFGAAMKTVLASRREHARCIETMVIQHQLSPGIRQGRQRVADLLWIAGKCFERTILAKARAHGMRIR